MQKLFQLISMLSIFLLLSCGSKKGFVLEDETVDSILLQAEQAYNDGNYDEAINLNQILLTNFPTSDRHVDAQLNIAQCYGAKEDFEDQFDLLLRILKENIIPEKVPKIYMQVGHFYENSAGWNPGNVSSDSTDYENAANYYRKAVFYPNSDDKATKAAALYRTALMYAKINNIETATKAYQEVISFYPESPYSELAKTKLLNPSNTDELPLEAVQLAIPAETPQPETQPETPAGAEDQIQEIIAPASDSLDFGIPQEEPEIPYEQQFPAEIDTTELDTPYDQQFPAEIDTSQADIPYDQQYPAEQDSIP